MTQKQAFPGAGVRKARKKRGNRLLVNFVIFTLVGAVLLAAGFFGRSELKKIAENPASETTRAIFKSKADESIDDIRLAVLEAAGVTLKDESQAAAAVRNNLISKTLRTKVNEMLSENQPAQDIATYIVTTMTQRATARLTGTDEATVALKTQIDEALAAQQDELTQLTAMKMEDVQNSTSTLEGIRQAISGLKPRPANYEFIFYSTIFLAVGALFVALGLFLGWVHFFCSQDTRDKVNTIVEPLNYLLPFFVGVIVFTLYPTIRVFIMAFQERYQLSGQFLGWGLGNFRDVLFGLNTRLPQALGNTFIYVLLTVPISVALSIILAYLLNQKIKLRALFQTAYFLPMVTSAVAVGMVWKFMFNGDYGIINWLLGLFGGEKIPWLTNPAYSMAVMVIYGIWDSLPMTIILLISGLQNIDEHYYTVAKVDGAKASRIFFRITVPLLSPTIGLVLIINSISAFKVFNSVVVLFSGTPGPMYNMYTMVYYIYEQINTSLEYGRAAAASLILFAVILAFTMIQRLIQRKWTYN